MNYQDYITIEEKVNRIIAFINWKGATFESKKKKIIKELSLITSYCNHNKC